MRWILAGLLLSGTVAAAQNPTLQGHPDDYVRADIDTARVCTLRGQAIFEGKGACLGCHRVNNVGSRKAPDRKKSPTWCRTCSA
jgi:mono/diheme cytochrome c family protein